MSVLETITSIKNELIENWTINWSWIATFGLGGNGLREFFLTKQSAFVCQSHAICELNMAKLEKKQLLVIQYNLKY